MGLQHPPPKQSFPVIALIRPEDIAFASPILRKACPKVLTTKRYVSLSDDPDDFGKPWDPAKQAGRIRQAFVLPNTK